MEHPDDPFANMSEEQARVIAPDFTLRKIIGEDVDIKQLFSPENIEKAQNVINQHKESFLDWVKKDMATLEQTYQAAEASPTELEAEIKKLARAAFVIKSQAGTFGFTLATLIAKSLDDFCQLHSKPSAEHMVAIRKHIDALATIFHNNIVGDGGKIGSELKEAIFKLADKYRAA